MILHNLFLCSLLGGLAAASPKLRLSTAAVGPVFVNPGQNGVAQVVTASNAGDGSLSLSVSASASWLGASVSGNFVQIALNTAALARGKYTGVVTVNDPNAVDAPQNITVTVQVGSGVPDSMDLYLPPGGSAKANFLVPNAPTITVTNPASGAKFSVASTGNGSFAFSQSYEVEAQSPAATAEGDYTGSFTIAGSTLAGDNKTVPVTAHVTSQPIAAWAPASVQFRIAQNAAKQTQYVAFTNGGLGSLTLASVMGAPSWLTAAIQGNLLALTADPSGLSPGTNTATIQVATNARNGAASIPVELDVLATGPPVTYYQGVLDNAIFQSGDPLAPGEIAALFGEQLSSNAPTQAAALPLGTTLGGASVFVNDQPAPVYYVSAGQIDFLIPYGAASGDAVVRVDRDGKRGNRVGIKIAPVAPRLMRLGIGGYAMAVLPDPTPTPTFPIPATPGLYSRPAKAGEIVVFYALGLGQTTPLASDGQAATAAQVGPVQVVFGESVLPTSGVPVTPQYAGLTPGLVGLYQVNVEVPAGLHGDAVPVYLNMNGVFSNRVNIAIE